MRKPKKQINWLKAIITPLLRAGIILLIAYLSHILLTDINNKGRRLWLGELHRAVPMVDGASGFMVRWYEAGKHGYILTAYHVVEDRFHDKKPVLIEYLDSDLEHKQAEGTIVHWDKAKDLALVRTNVRFPVLPIMSDRPYRSVNKFREVLAVGYPKEGNVHSQFITDGYIVNPKVEDKCPGCGKQHGGLTHDASIWYGFSGGPALDVDTKKVIGVNIRFAPAKVSTSSFAASASAPEINAFLESYWATK